MRSNFGPRAEAPGVGNLRLRHRVSCRAGKLSVYIVRWDFDMSRVIGVLACSLMVAACSSSIPGLDFLKSSPTTAALRFESEPPGAEVKVSGQSCRTPCELKLQVAELSAAFALKGYQPQTIAVRSESSVLSGASFVPNPVHADLEPVAGVAKKRAKKQTPVAASSENSPEAATDSSSAPGTSAPANTPFPARGDVR